MIDLYYNRTRKCFSLRRAGKVFGHTHTIILHNARFVVRESGRQHVAGGGQRYVFAWITGIPTTYQDIKTGKGIPPLRIAEHGIFSPIHFDITVPGCFLDDQDRVVTEAKSVYCWIYDGRPKLESMT